MIITITITIIIIIIIIIMIIGCGPEYPELLVDVDIRAAWPHFSERG